PNQPMAPSTDVTPLSASANRAASTNNRIATAASPSASLRRDRDLNGHFLDETASRENVAEPGPSRLRPGRPRLTGRRRTKQAHEPEDADPAAREHAEQEPDPADGPQHRADTVIRIVDPPRQDEEHGPDARVRDRKRAQRLARHRRPLSWLEPQSSKRTS